MFEHLDDQNPPLPRPLLVELVVAEGARRRRRRAVVAGGVAASLLVVAGGVRLSQLGGTDRSAITSNQPEPPAISSPDSGGEGTESGDGAATLPGPSGPESTPSSSEASAPLGATPFAALTSNGEVVLANPDAGGAISRILVPASQDGTQLGHQVALSPDRQFVYYEATSGSGDEAGESAIYKVSTRGGEPELVARGTRPTLSPDGKQLAYIRNSNQVRIRDLSSEEEQRFGGVPNADYAVQDLSFTANSKSLAFTMAAPNEPAVLYLLDLTLGSFAATASLNDAGRLSPPESTAAGTHWASPDYRGGGGGAGTIAAVETCCRSEGGGVDTGSKLTSVNADTGLQGESVPLEGFSGDVYDVTYDLSGQNLLVLTLDGSSYAVYRADGGALERLEDANSYTAIDW